ncbi:MAG: hypothetical protein M3404_05650, partial [Actinomycetota bacterium]|nr:hypothetical protein [Actinomycetota bacterium]
MAPAQSDRPATDGATAVRAAHHPGLAEVADATDTSVGTGPAEGRSLADTGPLTAEEVAGVAAAVATTLADLHELGIAHGAIDATQVIVTGDGRPVLRGPGPGGEPADDVAALGRLATSL